MHKLFLLATLMTLAAADAFAEKRWHLRASVYTTHFDSDPRHNDNSQLVGLDYYPESHPRWLVGGATFRNSWDQRAAYFYFGQRFELPPPNLYAKLTAGVLYGWRGEHQDAIPLNQLGVAPAIIPALEVKVGRYAGEFVVFGINGLMINLGAYF